MHTRILSLTLLAIAAIALSACRQPKKIVLTKEQKQRIETNVLKEAPTLKSPLGTTFGGAVRLIGVEISPSRIGQGGNAEVTYYWECLKELKGDWKIFVHLEKPRRKRQILDHHAVGELYPVSRWKKGQIIRDVQRFKLDADFPAGKAEVWLGVFDEGAWVSRGANERLPVTDKGKARTDKENRVMAVTVEVTKTAKGAKAAAAKPKREKPSLTVKRLASAPVIDGTIAEAEWAGAASFELSLRPDGRALGGPATKGRIARDDQHLYVAFSIPDKEIHSQLTARDATLWKEDVVEIYLDPGADGRDYLELQFAPSGAIFDALFASHRKPDWPEASKAFTIDMKAAVALEGTIGDGANDKAWSVEAAIPFAGIPKLAAGGPAAGEAWTVNFYRLDFNPKSGKPSQAVWSPAGGDFHNLGQAGRVTFQ
jgi:hypothetical protein